MFDDLRDTPEEEAVEAYSGSNLSYDPQPPEPENRIFGMTAAQRLVISLMLLATVFVLGLSCALVTERIWLY